MEDMPGFAMASDVDDASPCISRCPTGLTGPTRPTKIRPAFRAMSIVSIVSILLAENPVPRLTPVKLDSKAPVSTLLRKRAPPEMPPDYRTW